MHLYTDVTEAHLCGNPTMPPTALLLALSVAVSMHMCCVKARDNGLGRLPPRGWNTWCTGASCYNSFSLPHNENGQNYNHNHNHNQSQSHFASTSDQPGRLRAARGGKLHDNCSEALVKSVATEMVANGMLAAGYNRINLDDCWGAVSPSALGWRVYEDCSLRVAYHSHDRVL